MVPQVSRGRLLRCADVARRCPALAGWFGTMLRRALLKIPHLASLGKNPNSVLKDKRLAVKIFNIVKTVADIAFRTLDEGS